MDGVQFDEDTVKGTSNSGAVTTEASCSPVLWTRIVAERVEEDVVGRQNDAVNYGLQSQI